ncbi:hypothetical protein FE257_002834 [Aspergillus nanangensis]|uniref:Acyl-CoA oxidase C-terminal domain-containing protein n=1 Tax=Aspergillus nanangensis TaxID=2582783 RepID=A0AAD4GPV7_ASPNN|nr:hypothetical protein FE257_002834 [Aspergillus nanangensis]
MPATSPQLGLPRVGVVMARLIVDEEDRGIKPFVVWFNDGKEMNKGITSMVLLRRAGSKPLDHCITTFNHVRLQKSALLGDLQKPMDLRESFHSTIWRVSVGTLALATTLVPILKRSAFVAGKYSLRRHVNRPPNGSQPIVSFRTQHGPILHALAQVAVYEHYTDETVCNFVDMRLDIRVRQGIAAAFEAVLANDVQSSLFALSERCGAQGLFEYNNIIESQLEARGISIAEGDALVLCIRLASELILGRYSLPPAGNQQSLLARYEKCLFQYCCRLRARIDGDHRDDTFNTDVLPRCQALVEAIGYRMAYEAAQKAQVPPDLQNSFEARVVLQNSGWFTENIGLDMQAMLDMELRAMDSILPRLEQLLDSTDAEQYCTAPILSDQSWVRFISSLKTYRGNGSFNAQKGNSTLAAKI